MSAPAIGIRPRLLPAVTARVDPSHPLAQGLIGVMVPEHRCDMVSGRPMASVGASVGRVATGWGPAGEQTANSVPAYYMQLAATYPTSLSCLVVGWKRSGTSARCGVAVLSDQANSSEAGTGGFSIGYGNTPNGWDSSSGNNGDNYIFLHHSTAWRNTFMIIPDGYVTLGATTANGTSVTPYVNGLTSTAQTVGAPSGPLYATIGTSPSSRSAGADRFGTVALLVWNRVLTIADFGSLHADPFQMFRQ